MNVMDMGMHGHAVGQKHEMNVFLSVFLGPARACVGFWFVYR